MKGGVFGNKGKPKQGPRKFSPPTRRAIERDLWRAAGALPQLPRMRNRKTNLERSLAALGVDARLVRTLSAKQAAIEEANISGLAAGRTSGTMPERLIGAWLVEHKINYGGQGQGYSGSGWGFQVPLAGGRGFGGGGSVADIFLPPHYSDAKMGTVIRAQGSYWHMRPETANRDEAERTKLVAKGYKVVDVWDYETANRGVLDQKMKETVKNVSL